MATGWHLALVGFAVAACGQSSANDAAGGSTEAGEAPTTGLGTTVGPNESSSGTSGAATAGESGTSGTGGATLSACAWHAPGGQVEWALHCGTGGYERIGGAFTAQGGDVFFAFDYRATPNGQLQIGEEVLENEGEVTPDVAIVRMSVGGHVQWADPFGGAGSDWLGRMRRCGDGLLLSWEELDERNDFVRTVVERRDFDGEVTWSLQFDVGRDEARVYVGGVDCDPAGRALLVGSYDDGIDLGDGALPSEGAGRFVAALATDGQPEWSRPVEIDAERGTDNARASTGRFAPNGDAIISGRLEGAADLGAGPLDTADGRAFVGRITAARELSWATQYGPVDESTVLDTHWLAVAEDGTIGIAVTFLGTILVGDETFETQWQSEDLGERPPVHEVVVAALGPDGEVLWAAHDASTPEKDIHAVVFDHDGGLLVMIESQQGVAIDRYVEGVGQPWVSLPGLDIWHSPQLVPTPDDALLLSFTFDPESDAPLPGLELSNAGLHDLAVVKLLPDP